MCAILYCFDALQVIWIPVTHVAIACDCLMRRQPSPKPSLLRGRKSVRTGAGLPCTWVIS